MIDPQQFLSALDRADIRFVTGVPDSLLKEVCACISTHLPPDRHIISTNEGSAVGLAIGHYLATGRPALVYLQNSGLGNTINPLTSLADPLVYGVPVLLMIGWRGELTEDHTQIKDEPQHAKQGRVTPAQLDVLDIPYEIVDEHTEIDRVIMDLTTRAENRHGPAALLVRKNTFSSFKLEKEEDGPDYMARETAIQTLVEELPEDIPIVSTTGKASRELFEIRKAKGRGHHRDFLTVGGMGHASQIATGIALQKEEQKVVCIDGDGAILMHMGGLAISAGRSNLIHIVINNGAHDSVGGQPTQAMQIGLANIARVCGYELVREVETEHEIREAVREMIQFRGSCFLEIYCSQGARPELGRPDRKPNENMRDFMKFLQGAEIDG